MNFLNCFKIDSIYLSLTDMIISYIKLLRIGGGLVSVYYVSFKNPYGNRSFKA